MDFGVTGKSGGYYLAEQYRKNAAAGKSEGMSFAELAAAKAAGKVTEQDNVSGMSFEEMLKSKYPGVYYNVMDTSRIDGGLWGRNDYPWDAYFSEPADESVLGWTPSGAEPPMQDSKVQNKINSMAGKMSIVIPTELEEKMKNDPELEEQVVDKIDGFITKYYRPEANQGFLITFDENGEINHACIACEGRVTVSSSEFAEVRKAREAKHAEYERLAEESALKRKMMAQDKTTGYDEKAFDMVGSNAPQSVRDAWMETAEEVGINGLGMTSNGSTHITQMHIQQVIAHYYGLDYTNVLGNSVQSAIQATRKALYDFDHPLEPNKVRSIEEQQARIKERQFYMAFLEKLERLQ